MHIKHARIKTPMTMHMQIINRMNFQFSLFNTYNIGCFTKFNISSNMQNKCNRNIIRNYYFLFLIKSII